MNRRTEESTRLRRVRVAVCGNLPTVCDFLRKEGVIHIDKYSDGVTLRRETDYHLILVYAPQADGLLNTFVQSGTEDPQTVPIRLLNEPCCHAILLEIRMLLRAIAGRLSEEEAVSDG